MRDIGSHLVFLTHETDPRTRSAVLEVAASVNHRAAVLHIRGPGAAAGGWAVALLPVPGRFRWRRFRPTFFP